MSRSENEPVMKIPVPSLESQFASQRLNYLINAKPALYVELEKKGELQAHLTETGRQAAEMYERLERQMREEGKIPAHQISLIVEEIVRSDIVYA